MDIETLNRWLAAFALLLGIANTISIWLRNNARELAKKLDQIGDSLKGHDRRIQTVENEQRHMPTKEDMHELTVSITALAGELKTQSTELDSVARTVRRIDDYLRNAK